MTDGAAGARRAVAAAAAASDPDSLAAMRTLTDGLGSTQQALAERRIADAAAAMARVADACQALQDKGVALPVEVLTRARTLYAACEGAAADAKRDLQSALAQAGASRRAVRSYGGGRRRPSPPSRGTDR